MKRISALLLLMLIIWSCKDHKNHSHITRVQDFDPKTLDMESKPVNESMGQLLYLPVYSNVPYRIDTAMFDMSAFVAVHNTNLFSPIYLTSVLYFNQDGKLVDDFLKGERLRLDPLVTKDFYIPYEDKSGTGANFLIEWVADTLVTEPLIESVTICLVPNNSLAILSRGKIMREKR